MIRFLQPRSPVVRSVAVLALVCAVCGPCEAQEKQQPPAAGTPKDFTIPAPKRFTLPKVGEDPVRTHRLDRYVGPSDVAD